MTSFVISADDRRLVRAGSNSPEVGENEIMGCVALGIGGGNAPVVAI